MHWGPAGQVLHSGSLQRTVLAHYHPRYQCCTSSSLIHSLPKLHAPKPLLEHEETLDDTSQHARCQQAPTLHPPTVQTPTLSAEMHHPTLLGGHDNMHHVRAQFPQAGQPDPAHSSRLSCSAILIECFGRRLGGCRPRPSVHNDF